MASTLKDKRLAAEELLDAGVTNQEKLRAALPALISLQKALEHLNETTKACRTVAKNLSEACAAYALKHETIFDAEKLRDIRDKVRGGDITLGDIVYHFSTSPGEVKRENGDALTQKFLAALPEALRKTELKLNAGNADEETLAACGLVRGLKNTWSVKE